IIYTFKSYSYDPDGDELVLDWFVIPPEYDRGSYSDGDLFYVKIAAQPCGSDVTVTVLLTVRANGKRAEATKTTSADICHLPSVTQVAQRTQATPIISNHLETTP